MIRIGMMRQFKRPNTLVLAAAVSAKMMDMEFFFFNPEDVDFERRTILGLFYEEGKWARRETVFPDAIDNSPSRKENARIYEELEKSVPFTMHRIGNKDVIYQRIKNEKIFDQLLIPTVSLNSVHDAMALLKDHRRIIAKPQGGNRGKGIYFIEDRGDRYTIIGNLEKFEVEPHRIHPFLVEHIIGRKYIGQPYIQSLTKDGLPYDIRIHVRRGHNAVWKIVRIYPRIGTGDGIASNLSQGGYIGKIDKFLQRQFPDSYMRILRELTTLGTEFPDYFQKGYDQPIDALGLDIGIDEKGKLWMFEVNSFPGSTFFELEAQMVAMAYARYLAQRGR